MLRWVFYASLLLSFFVWGFLSHAQKLFPFQIIQKAKIAYQALLEIKHDKYRELHSGEVLWFPIWDQSGLSGPTATTFRESRGNEYVLVVGNKRSLLKVCPKVGCLAWIIDREGRVVHAWKNKPGLWKLNNNSHNSSTEVYPASAHLYPNGDILVGYQAFAAFPYAIGIAKFDRDSNLLWKKENFYHHWFTVDNQGRILTPALKVVKSPFKIIDRKKEFKCEDGQLTTDYIAILDSEGNPTDYVDMAAAFSKADLAGILFNAKDCDPFHLNMVSINENEARKSEFLDTGDFLISFRSLSTIGIIDKDTKKFKWYWSGPIAQQHSPLFYKENEIIVLDNSGGEENKGTTRVLSVNINTKEARTIFPQENTKPPTWDFYVQTGGFINLHPNEKRMMVAFTYPAGFVWEIDIESGEVLWEYRNITQMGEKFLRMPIYTSLYVQDIGFPTNQGRFD